MGKEEQELQKLSVSCSKGKSVENCGLCARKIEDKNKN